MCNHETTLSVSNCCHADYSEEYEMCKDCKEHCGTVECRWYWACSCWFNKEEPRQHSNWSTNH
jgi:hypothetical protein